MNIDAATIAYQSRPIEIPQVAQPASQSPIRQSGTPQALQGSGAVIAADSRKIDRDSPLYEQCRQFEGLFMEMMLKEMRKTLNKSDSILDGGFAEEIFEDMLYQEHASNMVKTGSMGLADMVYLELVRSQA